MARFILPTENAVARPKHRSAGCRSAFVKTNSTSLPRPNRFLLSFRFFDRTGTTIRAIAITNDMLWRFPPTAGGAIFAGDLKAPKARLLLIAALGDPTAHDRIRELFATLAP
jgi:hypothetical protein